MASYTPVSVKCEPPDHQRVKLGPKCVDCFCGPVDKMRTMKVRTTADATDNDSLLCSLISETHGKPLLLMGDFNFPDIDWELHHGNTPMSSKFIDSVDEAFLTQHVNLGSGHTLQLCTRPCIRVRARMPTGGMPTSENSLVRAECRPRLGGM